MDASFVFKNFDAAKRILDIFVKITLTSFTLSHESFVETIRTIVIFKVTLACSAH